MTTPSSGSVAQVPPQEKEPPWIHVRREPFDFGLLPLPSLMHNEGVPALKKLRSELLAKVATSSGLAPMSSPSDTNECGARITLVAVASGLGLTDSQAHLVLDALASVLPDEAREVDPLSSQPADVDSGGADVDYLILFLYTQIYRRVPHRAPKDATVLADVWPQPPSPFDSFTTASTSQIKASSIARQRSMPGQQEEEAHQLAFVQKHLPNLLALIAEPQPEGEDEGSKVVTGDMLEYLGLLLRAGGLGDEAQGLSQVTPFFANSDPDMPAAPVPVSHVHDWLLKHVCAASEHMRDDEGEPPAPPPPPPGGAGGGDVSMADAPGGGGHAANGLLGVAPPKEWWPAGMTCIDGVTKMSVLKSEHDIEGGNVKVSHCHDSVVYVLAPLKYASIVGCSDSIIVLGPVGKAVKVELCERVQLIVPCARIKIANCRECTFYLGTNQSPLVIGDNHNLQVAPYNTFYPKLEAHLAMARVDPAVNKWDTFVTLGVVDPHDAMSHPAGVADAQAEGATCLPPDRFVPFVVPFRSEHAQQLEKQLQTTRANPFPLPKPYLTALQHKTKTVESLRQTLKTAVLEEAKKKELTSVIQAHFKDWLFASGNIRQVYDLARLDRDP